MKKIIVFLSSFSKNNEGKEKEYFFESDEEKLEGIVGEQTNEAPVKYLMKEIKKANEEEKVEILCVTSKNVVATKIEEDKIWYEVFQKRIENYCEENQYTKPEFRAIPYDYEENTLQKISDRKQMALQVWKKLSQFIKKGDEIYIDYTGGLRDFTMLIILFARQIEYLGISFKEAVYSQFPENKSDSGKIYSIRYLYDMFQLLNGMSNFTMYGNSSVLSSYFEISQKENMKINSHIKILLETMKQFSDCISLCLVKDIDKILNELNNGIKELPTAMQEEKENLQGVIFQGLLENIKEKFYLSDKEEKITYLKLIRWCFDNNLLQQALTLYTEKMPLVYFESGLFNRVEMEHENQKDNTEANRFLEALSQCDQTEESERKKMKWLLEQLTHDKNDKEIVEKFDREIDNLIKSHIEIQGALEQLKSDREIHYDKSGKLKEDWKKETFVCNQKNLGKFLKWLSNQNKMIDIYCYGEVKSFESESNYKKRLRILLEDSNWNNKKEQRDIFSYYLLIKTLRNYVNHAEIKFDTDEEKLLGQLLEQYDLELDFSSENIIKTIKDILKQAIRKNQEILKRN